MFDYSRLFSADLPDPAPRWAPFPKYYFIGGNNDPGQIPVEGLIDAAAAVLRREGSKLAIYNLGLGPQGYPGLRQFVADKSARHRGIKAPMEDILITTGSGQGIDMISKLLINPGDTVLAEEYCYQGALNRFRKLGAKLEGMKLDADGIVIEALARQLADLKANGIAPKFIYTIPTIQNPTASILPLDRRQALIRLAREYNVAIFEDECYADLLWKGIESPPALYALAPDCVLHIGSFSKSLAPALRLGYLIAGWDLMRRLLPLKGDSGTGALDQMIVAEYFSRHFDDHVGHLNAVLHEKLATMTEAVARDSARPPNAGCRRAASSCGSGCRPRSTCARWSGQPPRPGSRSIPVRTGRSAPTTPATACGCASPCRARRSFATVWLNWRGSATSRRESRSAAPTCSVGKFHKHWRHEGCYPGIASTYQDERRTEQGLFPLHHDRACPHMRQLNEAWPQSFPAWMAGLMPAIHVFAAINTASRGWPGQGRP
ncbi:MAG: PLP-dependent aminotransferase family protein [Rhodopila sp.]